MAQAALLNLKGTQLHPDSQSSRIPSPNFGLSPAMSTNALPVEPFVEELPPPIGHHNQGAFDSYRTLRTSHGQYDDGLNAQAAEFVSSDLRVPGNVLGYSNSQTLSRELLEMALGGTVQDGGSASRAQNGYTPMERLLLQAHEQRQQLQEANRLVQASHQQNYLSNYNNLAADFRADHNTTLGAGGQTSMAAARGRDDQTGRRLMNILPSMSEDEFHAAARGQRQVMSGDASNARGPQTRSEQTVSQLSLDLDAKLSFQRQRNQTHAEARAQAQAEAQALHTRSTTVPSHYLTSNTHSLLNNLGQITSNTHSTSNVGIITATHRNYSNNLGNSAKDFGTARFGSNVGMPPPTSTNSLNKSTSLATLRDSAPGPVPKKSRTSSVSSSASTAGKASSTASNATRIDTTTFMNRRSAALARSRVTPSHDADDDDEGSGLDSPALSYSASVRTPASLSPTTPFSAFGDTFDGPSMNAAAVAGVVHGGKQQQGTGETVGLGVGLVQQKIRAGE